MYGKWDWLFAEYRGGPIDNYWKGVWSQRPHYCSDIYDAMHTEIHWAKPIKLPSSDNWGAKWPYRMLTVEDLDLPPGFLDYLKSNIAARPLSSIYEDLGPWDRTYAHYEAAEFLNLVSLYNDYFSTCLQFYNVDYFYHV